MEVKLSKEEYDFYITKNFKFFKKFYKKIFNDDFRAWAEPRLKAGKQLELVITMEDLEALGVNDGSAEK